MFLRRLSKKADKSLLLAVDDWPEVRFWSYVISRRHTNGQCDIDRNATIMINSPEFNITRNVYIPVNVDCLYA